MSLLTPVKHILKMLAPKAASWEWHSQAQLLEAWGKRSPVPSCGNVHGTVVHSASIRDIDNAFCFACDAVGQFPAMLLTYSMCIFSTIMVEKEGRLGAGSLG